MGSKIDKLQELTELKDAGYISDEEFEQLKNDIIEETDNIDAVDNDFLSNCKKYKERIIARPKIVVIGITLLIIIISIVIFRVVDNRRNPIVANGYDDSYFDTNTATFEFVGEQKADDNNYYHNVYITGKVRNTSSVTGNATISYKMYDDEGTLLGTAVGNVMDVNPGEVASFKAVGFPKGRVRHCSEGVIEPW